MDIVVNGRKTRDELLRALVQAAVRISDPGEARDFLGVVFTPTERENFGKRVEILKGLRKKMPYRQMKQELGSTDNTIARMSNLLKEASPSLLRFIDELVREDMVQEGKGLRFSS